MILTLARLCWRASCCCRGTLRSSVDSGPSSGAGSGPRRWACLGWSLVISGTGGLCRGFWDKQEEQKRTDEKQREQQGHSDKDDKLWWWGSLKISGLDVYCVGGDTGQKLICIHSHAELQYSLTTTRDLNTMLNSGKYCRNHNGWLWMQL